MRALSKNHQFNRYPPININSAICQFAQLLIAFAG